MNIDTPAGMAQAVAWQRQHLSTVADGGTWLIPRSGSIIKVSHSTKTLTFVTSLLPELPDIRRVTEAMGWTFVDKTL